MPQKNPKPVIFYDISVFWIRDNVQQMLLLQFAKIYTMTALTASSSNTKPNKFILAQNVWRSGKTCMEKIKALLKVMDSTAAMLVRSSKRWSMAAAITVGIDDENEDNMDDEDTISGRQSTMMNTRAFS